MEQERIGKFILKCRSEKKLTQQELADKIGVTNKAISKWENGRGMPDYSIFNELCNALDITVVELLNGEKNSNENIVITEYINYKEKKSQKKIIYYLITIIITLIFSTLLIYFINNYKNIKVYELSGSSKNFIYENGLFIKSNINNIFKYGNIQSTTIKNENIIFIELVIKKDNGYNLITKWKNETSTLIENHGYEEYFSNVNKEDIKNNLYLIVYYYENKELKIDKIKLNTKIILSNDKILNLKKQKISRTKKTTSSNYKNYLEKQTYQEKLYNMGFQNIDNPFHSCKTCITKKISDSEYISTNLINDYIYYNYKDETTEIRAIRNKNNQKENIIFNIKKENKWTYLIYDKKNKDLKGSEQEKNIKEKIKEAIKMINKLIEV